VLRAIRCAANASRGYVDDEITNSGAKSALIRPA
jgi:hypothetical protein